jgi:hypothetical protein
MSKAITTKKTFDTIIENVMGEDSKLITLNDVIIPKLVPIFVSPAQIK